MKGPRDLPGPFVNSSLLLAPLALQSSRLRRPLLATPSALLGLGIVLPTRGLGVPEIGRAHV